MAVEKFYRHFFVKFFIFRQNLSLCEKHHRKAYFYLIHICKGKYFLLHLFLRRMATPI